MSFFKSMSIAIVHRENKNATINITTLFNMYLFSDASNPLHELLEVKAVHRHT